MKSDAAPRIRDLDERDARAFLARHFVGRLAFGDADRIDIRPVHYVFSNGSIYGRTSPGVKVTSENGSGRARVVFEVDEVESLFRWRSVIARGEFSVLDPEESSSGESVHATQLLRRLQPSAFVPGDPVPERTLIFKIFVSELSGRAMD